MWQGQFKQEDVKKERSLYYLNLITSTGKHVGVACEKSW